jgi:hypothetical protein
LESEAPVLSALALAAKQYWPYSQQDIERWRPLLAVTAEEIAANPTFVAVAGDPQRLDDRVFALGRASGGGRYFSRGVFTGKRAMCSMTVGGSDAAYSGVGDSWPWIRPRH